MAYADYNDLMDMTEAARNALIPKPQTWRGAVQQHGVEHSGQLQDRALDSLGD